MSKEKPVTCPDCGGGGCSNCNGTGWVSVEVDSGGYSGPDLDEIDTKGKTIPKHKEPSGNGGNSGNSCLNWIIGAVLLLIFGCIGSQVDDMTGSTWAGIVVGCIGTIMLVGLVVYGFSYLTKK